MKLESGRPYIAQWLAFSIRQVQADPNRGIASFTTVVMKSRKTEGEIS